MATPNPTAGGSAVPFTFPERLGDFLRHRLPLYRAGIESELARSDLSQASREQMERESDAFERLLRGIREGAIVPDAVMIRVASELAEKIDANNAFAQAQLEHRALCSLLAQLEEGSER